MAVAIITSFQQLLDNSSNVLNGGSVTVYASGTTTPLSLFSDTSLSVSATNPITLDAYGRHAMTYIATATYKILVKNSSGTTLYTRDGIDPGVPVGTGVLAIANGGTSATSAAAALAALGGATAAEVASVSADVAALAGSAASTAKTHIATGTTAQRDTVPSQGDFRRNTTTARWEGYNNSSAFENFLTSTEAAATSDALTGSSTTLWMSPAATRAASAFQSLLLHVNDTKATTTSGGTFTSGAWQTRTLNTSLTNEITGASLGSNQITLPSGTYFIDASAPAVFCGFHQVRLRNTTDSTTTLVGTSEVNSANDSAATGTRSVVRGRFTIASQKVFELQHRCQTTRSSDGFGSANSFGENEIYSQVMIFKVA